MRKIHIKQDDINWDEPMWVVNIAHRGVCLTTGFHTGESFQGTILPCEIWPNGETRNDWDKRQFIPLKGSHKIKISNKDGQ